MRRNVRHEFASASTAVGDAPSNRPQQPGSIFPPLGLAAKEQFESRMLRREASFSQQVKQFLIARDP